MRISLENDKKKTLKHLLTWSVMVVNQPELWLVQKELIVLM
jgi:hypothetical protein